MKNKEVTLPKKKYEYGYELAYQIASEQLAGIADIEQQCLNSGAQYIDSQKVSIKYLNRSYLINIPGAEVLPATGEETVPIRDKILILHYFTRAKGTPLSHKLVTYRELKEGPLYAPVFYQRAIKPIVEHFGNEPHRLLDIAAALGGEKADYGDVAVTINAFPRVPITLVLWRGDDEFPPEGKLMFDSTVPDYLTSDDTHALCEIIAWRLVKLLKAGGDSSGKG
ncbi:hypothetical protein ES703_64929 [subsurface metagenome]